MPIPNMTPEVIDAVHLMYEDDPDVEADCYSYLQKLVGSGYEGQLKAYATTALSEMDRCTICGEPLVHSSRKEWHWEAGCYEDVGITYCPNCEGMNHD